MNHFRMTKFTRWQHAVVTLGILFVSLPTAVSAFTWDYTWDDPDMFSYCAQGDCFYGYDMGYDYMDDYYADLFLQTNLNYRNTYDFGYNDFYYPSNQYGSAYAAYLPVRGTQTGQPYYESQYQSQYQSSYSYPSYGNRGAKNTGYGYGDYGYGIYGNYGNYGGGTPTGDTIPYVNEPLCDYPGYGRYSCLYHPGQPLYDYWTGTWY